jgi:signal transduction histidine kinase
VYQDRDRIARDLHDLVIQRLFAVGLGLQGVNRQIEEPAVTARLAEAVNNIDLTIRDIRRSIFSLQEVAEHAGGTSLRTELLRAVQEPVAAFGFEPRLSFVGPLDSLVPDEVRADLLATLREALANAARHAGARNVHVEVAVDADGERLSLVVRDDGRGVDADAMAGAGLANMAARAKRWRGECVVGALPAEGTEVRWTVPLTAPEDAP